MKITEIQRKDDDSARYSTANFKVTADELKGLKMVPGSKNLGWTFGKSASVFTGATHIIQLYDLKHPGRGRYLVGWLQLRKSGFPLPNSYEVANVNIDDTYRGQGLGETLYGIAMKLLGFTIVADDTQTTAARRLWVRLSQIPGVEIRGYTTVGTRSWKNRENPDEIYDWDDKPIIKSLRKVGGQELGGDNILTYVGFPVTGNVNRNELESLNKRLSIYSARHPEEGGTDNGLYARWRG